MNPPARWTCRCRRKYQHHEGLQRQRGADLSFISHNPAVVRHERPRGRDVPGPPGGTSRPSASCSPSRATPTRACCWTPSQMHDIRAAPARQCRGEVPNPTEPPPGCAFNPRCPHANARCRSERPALLGGHKHRLPAMRCKRAGFKTMRCRRVRHRFCAAKPVPGSDPH